MSLIITKYIFIIISASFINFTSATPVVNDNNNNTQNYDKKISIERRIYHGDETDISEVPFMVFIKIQVTPQVQYGEEDTTTCIKMCSGVIIDRNTVLTAGHCVENSQGIQIIAGSSNPLFDKNVQRRIPYDVIVHPSYRYDTIKNTTIFDFALLKFRTPLVFNQKVRAVLLPKGNNVNVTGEMGKVCGWGDTDENESQSYVLLCTSAHILTNTYCDSIQQKIQLSSDMVCSGRSSCQGDSGSGLIYDGIVIGIVSFTLGPCNYAVPPVVYGKVTTILDFIRSGTTDDRLFFPE